MEYLNDISEMEHSGVKRRSGRYPYGSGEFPYQHEAWFKGFGTGNGSSGKKLSDYTHDLRAQGIDYVDIAKGFGMSTTQLRKELSREKTEKMTADYAKAYEMYQAGKSYSEIGRQLGMTDGNVRYILRTAAQSSAVKNNNTANVLRKNVDEKGMVDIGPGVEIELGVSKVRLDNAAEMLTKDGYIIHNIYVDQLGTENGKKTPIRVLAKGDIDYQTARENYKDIKTINDYSIDNGENWRLGLPPVNSISSDRIFVRYNEEGGVLKDGLIELRQGVKDLDLGNTAYGQVRIGVDGTHYLKGMALYVDDKDIPKGYDIVVNSNKHVGTDKMDCFKKMKTVSEGSSEIDMDNPFGAAIKDGEHLKRVPRYIIDENGKEVVSPINIVYEAGDWADWSKSVSPQELSKQKEQTIRKQLGITLADKEREFKEISELTNPAVKQKLLQEFADDCDKSAEHLKAMAFPGQQSHVILPFPDIPDGEVYAPNYQNGEKVALIRHPHNGPQEIPVLTVNNNYAKAKKLIGNAPDAVGINHKVAEQLSGADFDGDSVAVIPLRNGLSIQHREQFEGLKGFEPKEAYKGVGNFKKMTDTQKEMGMVTNLIADMGLKGAPEEDLVKAIKHSMVVIDAEKHGLDYKRSEKDNDIAELRLKYQGKAKGGASTLITRAGSEEYVPDRKRAYHDDPETGEKIYIQKEPKTYIDKKTGELKTIEPKKIKSTKMAEYGPWALLSGNDGKTGHPTEIAYAEYADAVLKLANAARKEAANTKNMELNTSAKKLYSAEVESLDRKLKLSKLNAPRERQAQILANVVANAKMSANPSLDKEHQMRIKQQALGAARAHYGASRPAIEINDREWEAIQAGAISHSRLNDILKYADMSTVRERATPRRSSRLLSTSDISRIKTLSNRGVTIAELAQEFGVSASTIQNALA